MTSKSQAQWRSRNVIYRHMKGQVYAVLFPNIWPWLYQKYLKEEQHLQWGSPIKVLLTHTIVAYFQVVILHPFTH